MYYFSLFGRGSKTNDSWLPFVLGSPEKKVGRRWCAFQISYQIHWYDRIHAIMYRIYKFVLSPISCSCSLCFGSFVSRYALFIYFYCWQEPQRALFRSLEDKNPKDSRFQALRQWCGYLRKFQQTPGQHTPGRPKYQYGRIFFINRWLRVWGIFQGHVGVFSDDCHFVADICLLLG